MGFKNLSSPEQMRSTKREEFYKEHMSIAKFHETFDSVHPELNHLTFYEKYKYLEDKTGVTPEVWGALKYIPMSDKGNWIDFGYSISTHGNLVSHKRKADMPQKTTADGYKYMFLCRRYINIQRAVLSSFCSEITTIKPKDKLTANHIDKNRANNFVLNLEWMDFVDNVKDANHKSVPISITVIGPKTGLPIGSVYYLEGRKDLGKMGIDVRKFKTACRKSARPYDLKVEKLESIDNLEFGIPDLLIDFLKSRIPN